MKIQAYKVEAYIKDLPRDIAAVLIYGPDASLMRERATVLGKKIVPDLNDPFNVSVVRGDVLVQDGARLSAEANALSMMGGRRVVRIEDAKDALAPALRDYLTSPNLNTLVILEAGELGPRSPVRLLVEKAQNAAALPCYAEDARDTTNLIRSSLQEQGYSISSDASSWLAAQTAGDRGRVRQEIEKLVTYMRDTKQISLDDVQACCGAAGDRSLDDLVYSAGGGKPEEALKSYQTLLAEGIPPIAILRALQGHFRRLHLARARMDNGEDAETIMKTLQPPVFFKLEASFRAQIQKRGLSSLEKIMDRLMQIEAQCKRTGTPAETLCAQALLAISRS